MIRDMLTGFEYEYMQDGVRYIYFSVFREKVETEYLYVLTKGRKTEWTAESISLVLVL